MSQFRISSALGARPNPYVGDCAPAIACTATHSEANSANRILDAPVSRNPPTLDGVEVVAPVRAARFHQIVQNRLHVPAFVGAAGLKNHFPTVPFPAKAKASKGDGEHRRLQRSILPGAAAIHGDFDAANRATAGPGKSGNLVEAGT